MLQGNGGHYTLTSGLLDMGTKCTCCTVGGGGRGGVMRKTLAGCFYNLVEVYIPISLQQY